MSISPISQNHANSINPVMMTEDFSAEQLHRMRVERLQVSMLEFGKQYDSWLEKRNEEDCESEDGQDPIADGAKMCHAQCEPVFEECRACFQEDRANYGVLYFYCTLAHQLVEIKADFVPFAEIVSFCDEFINEVSPVLESVPIETEIRLHLQFCTILETRLLYQYDSVRIRPDLHQLLIRRWLELFNVEDIEEEIFSFFSDDDHMTKLTSLIAINNNRLQVHKTPLFTPEMKELWDDTLRIGALCLTVSNEDGDAVRKSEDGEDEMHDKHEEMQKQFDGMRVALCSTFNYVPQSIAELSHEEKLQYCAFLDRAIELMDEMTNEERFDDLISSESLPFLHVLWILNLRRSEVVRGLTPTQERQLTVLKEQAQAFKQFQAKLISLDPATYDDYVKKSDKQFSLGSPSFCTCVKQHLIVLRILSELEGIDEYTRFEQLIEMYVWFILFYPNEVTCLKELLAILSEKVEVLGNVVDSWCTDRYLEKIVSTFMFIKDALIRIQADFPKEFQEIAASLETAVRKLPTIYPQK